MTFLRNHWKIALPVAAALAAFGAWLIFGFFGFHTLFIDDKVNEEGPVFASGAGAAVVADSADADTADSTPTDTTPTDSDSADGEPTDSDSTDSDSTGSDSSDSAPDTAAPADTTPAEPQVLVLASGEFSDRSHPGRGVASVLNDGSEQRFLRFEDFETDNGPDLNVYLSAAPADAPASAFDDDFVDLGDLKGNVGSQNYEIPPEVDLDRYPTVVVWCVRFGVAFTVATLSS